MNDGQSSRQQIVEKIKNSTNILVTVSSSPSVDELSAALGLTSMLNGVKKHATAVVSGDIPPAITFLEPANVFENTVDSLRDFIIALDKEKADHLRYKVEGDVVKIFITPYRTTISQDDLDFSQGDYNVELVLALGVKDQDSLDTALAAHGKILHDATVATLSCGETPSDLGQIDWFEPNASSISEMLVSLSEALKDDAPVIDEQIATAFLTGIVSATDRFSNNRTSSKVMTMAAQLMAAGANQQLIAAKLEEAHEIGPEKSADVAKDDTSDGMTDMNEGESTKLSKEAKPEAKKPDDGTFSINHEKAGTLEEVAAATAAEKQAEAAKTAEEELAEQLSDVAPAAAATPSVADLQSDLASASAELEKQTPEPEEPVLPEVKVQVPADERSEPSMGGTLNATTEQAQHDKQNEIDADRNKTILSHEHNKYVGDSQPTFQSPFNAASDDGEDQPSVDIFADESQTLPTVAQPDIQPIEEPVDQGEQPSLPPAETLADIDRMNRHTDDAGHDEARSAVELAYEATPLPTPPQPSEPMVAPIVGEVVQEQAAPFTPSPFSSPDILPPPAPAPVDFSQLPPPPPLPTFPAPQGPTPPEQLGQIFASPAVEVPQPEAPASNDPNQFKIPGQ